MVWCWHKKGFTVVEGAPERPPKKKKKVDNLVKTQEIMEGFGFVSFYCR